MIKTHFLVINKHKAFRANVFDMANLEHFRSLLELNITPDELLSQLKKWQTFNNFHVSIDWVRIIYASVYAKDVQM